MEFRTLCFVTCCGIPSRQMDRVSSLCFPTSTFRDVDSAHTLRSGSQKKRARNDTWIHMKSTSTWRENEDESHGQLEERLGEPDTANQETLRFSAQGMTVDDLFLRSIGTWKSQRSSHNLLWRHVELGESEIVVEALHDNDATVAEVCALYDVEVGSLRVRDDEVDGDDCGHKYPYVCQCSRMSWQGSSDWEEDKVLSGSTVMVVVKDGPYHGRLLRSVGYAESIPAVGTWVMNPNDGMFVVETAYERAAAEERIWFVTPNMRMRVALIKTQSGTGVINASLSTEIRKMS